MELSEEMKESFKNMSVLLERGNDAMCEAKNASFTFIYNLLKEVGPVKFPESMSKLEIAYHRLEDFSDAVGVIKGLYISEVHSEAARMIREDFHGTTETVMVEFVDGNKTDFFYLDPFCITNIVFRLRFILKLEV